MKHRVGLYVSSICIVLATVVLLAYPPFGAAQSPGIPSLSVNAAALLRPINPEIYGIASFGLDPQFAQEIRVPNVRWGGDTTTRYNWLVDSSNMGFDWYFVSGCSQTPLLGFRSCGLATPVPGASVDQMISTFAPMGARALVTIPIIPYVDRGADSGCSFPVAVYGAQKKTDPGEHPDGETCGNGISIYGQQLTDSDVYANHVDNSPWLQQGWIQHLVSTFGTAANGGVPYYQLDNEPSGWFNTHRDVLPVGASYADIAALGEEYGAMIKQNDPSASVFGPSDFSGQGWVGKPGQQNGLYAGQYYLQQMASYQQQHGQRILDYFDEHYYATSADDASELASTRTLWDPSYAGPRSVFNGPIELIPRFRTWIDQYYPGTKLSISEYGFSSWRNPLVDALTEADVLGIFGREGVDFANMWTIPMPPAAVLCVFRMFRNYDGQGGQFGDMALEATSSNQSRLAVFGALRTSDHALTILVINKTTQAIATAVSLANFMATDASVYSFSGADLTKIVRGSDVGVVGNQIDYDFPAYSATLFVVPNAGQFMGTATVLSESPTRPRAGENITLSAAIAPTSGSGIPTGSVDFVNNQTVLATVPLISGKASLQTAELSAGAHTITANYSGDANYGASTSNALSISIPASPDYALALSEPILRVGRGATGTLTVMASSENGFAQAVTFGCTELPSGATCNFTPPSLTLRAGVVSSTVLSISTPAAVSKAGLFAPASHEPGAPRDFVLLMCAIAAILCFTAAKQKQVRAKIIRRPLLFLTATACVCLAGCAALPGPYNTQLGKENQNGTAYVISVNAGGMKAPSHSQDLTLNILN